MFSTCEVIARNIAREYRIDRRYGTHIRLDIATARNESLICSCFGARVVAFVEHVQNHTNNEETLLRKFWPFPTCIFNASIRTQISTQIPTHIVSLGFLQIRKLG
jgi:hypothetical protein